MALFHGPIPNPKIPKELRQRQQHRGLRAPHWAHGACRAEGKEFDLPDAVRPEGNAAVEVKIQLGFLILGILCVANVAIILGVFLDQYVEVGCV